MTSDPYLDNISALAAVVREMDAAVPALKHGACRHCREAIVFKPYWLDGKQPNPPIWSHLGSSTTCRTRPADWPADGWPHAEPLSTTPRS